MRLLTEFWWSGNAYIEQTPGRSIRQVGTLVKVGSEYESRLPGYRSPQRHAHVEQAANRLATHAVREKPNITAGFDDSEEDAWLHIWLTAVNEGVDPADLNMRAIEDAAFDYVMVNPSDEDIYAPVVEQEAIVAMVHDPEYQS